MRTSSASNNIITGRTLCKPTGKFDEAWDLSHGTWQRCRPVPCSLLTRMGSFVSCAEALLAHSLSGYCPLGQCLEGSD
jgi:hypothetical protein